MFHQWRRKGESRGGRRPFRPRLEALEERVVPDTTTLVTQPPTTTTPTTAVVSSPTTTTTVVTSPSTTSTSTTQPASTSGTVSGITQITLDPDCNTPPVAGTDGLTTSGTTTGTGTVSGAINAPLSSYTDALGRAIVVTPNANGTLVTSTAPDGSVTRYQYNPQGQLVTVTDASGTLGFTYNANGTLAGRSLPDGTTQTFTYDANGNLTGLTDATGTTTFTYDSAGRLQQVNEPSASLTYTYDSLGRRSSLSDGTYTLNYRYDSLGRLSALLDGTGTPLVQYQYDSSDRLTLVTNGNGTTTSYTYNAAGQVASVVNANADGTVLSSFQYAYSAQGQPISVTTPDGVTTYGYDGGGQLTSVALPGGRTITYQYDANGNRIAVADGASPTTYQTNAYNQYTQVGSATYQYDDNGNLIASTSASGTTRYTYNALGQLVSAASPTGTITYQYDALGYRVAMTQNGQTTQLLVDPVSPGEDFGEYTSSGQALTHDVYGVGLTSRVDASTGMADYYAFDASGNTADVTGPTGSVLLSYQYLPFGQVLSSEGAGNNPYTYHGAQGVVASGSLYLMGNRPYDPQLGRFLTANPFDTNLYTYANNNPTQILGPAVVIAAEVSFLTPPSQQTTVGTSAPAGTTTTTTASLPPTGTTTSATASLPTGAALFTQAALGVAGSAPATEVVSAIGTLLAPPTPSSAGASANYLALEPELFSTALLDSYPDGTAFFVGALYQDLSGILPDDAMALWAGLF